MSPLFLKSLKQLCTTDELIHSYNCFFPEPSDGSQLENVVPWLVRSCQQIIDELPGVVVSVEEVAARAIRISGYTHLPFEYVFGHGEFLQIFLSRIFTETVFERSPQAWRAN